MDAGMDFTLTPVDIHGLADELERAEAFDPDDADDEALADMVAACKRIEDAAETARKEVFEDALSERVDNGETVGPVAKQLGSHTYVTDAEGAFAAVAERGEDPLDVAKVKVGDLRDILGADADRFLGQSEYSYFRRVD